MTATLTNDGYKPRSSPLGGADMLSPNSLGRSLYHVCEIQSQACGLESPHL